MMGIKVTRERRQIGIEAIDLEMIAGIRVEIGLGAALIAGRKATSPRSALSVRFVYYSERQPR
jgi:hypothetical protein